MAKHGKRHKEKGKRKWPAGIRLVLRRSHFFLFPFSFFLGGCAWDSWSLFTPTPPPGSAETLVLRGDKLEAEKPVGEGKTSEALAGAQELYRLNNYGKARQLFHSVAEDNKNPPLVAEEARFYEAECLRREQKYPRAADTYHKMLLDFPSGAYREQAVQRMFDIANYWLEDTRDEMKQSDEVKDGKRWLVVTPVCHFEATKPLIDEEGRALETLERVRYNDITGPLADKALFLAGSVKFFREDYREADHYFSQLVEMHPNSPLATQAVELGIISKHMGTGGADYDGRKVAEARQLINTALTSYPKLAHDEKKRDFLVRQLASCNMQQAEKDFKIAEFYKRTGHPGSAYFYFEIVRRRYPGTPYCDQATQKMWDLRKELEKEESKKAAEAQPKPPTAPKPEAVPPDKVPPANETAPAPRAVPPGGFPKQPETTPAPRAVPGGFLGVPETPRPGPSSAAPAQPGAGQPPGMSGGQ